MKKALIISALLCVGLLSILLFNTFRFTSKQIRVEPVDRVSIDEAGASERLAQALRYKTISHEKPLGANYEEILAFHDYLQRSFPRVNSVLQREVVGGHSLLYTWKGSEANLEPVLLMAHLDVVPVEGGTEARWKQEPFGGAVFGGYVWGRGAMDDKSSLMGILEAAEMLLAKGLQPRRTIYFAFGHDEEIGGKDGARKIASLLAERGVRLYYVLDEGLFIADGVVPGVNKPVALVGIAEKGFLSVTLTVEAGTGHSSTPPTHTAIGILSLAVNKLEENQMPGSLRGPLSQMFDYVGPEMAWRRKVIFANLWLFKPLVERELSASPGTNASIRTTTAVTVIEGGIKENVLPSRARAIVNFRILPGDSIEGVIAHARSVINDPRVKIEKYGDDFNEPSEVSNVDSDEFMLIHKTIRQVYPNILVAPALMVGATDSRHYLKLTRSVYRFLPFQLNVEDISRFHGLDERLSAENYSRGIRFYYQLISNSAWQ